MILSAAFPHVIFFFPGTSHLLPLAHPFCFMNHGNSEDHSEGLVAVKQCSVVFHVVRGISIMLGRSA